jgi:hypothetical protein
LLPELVEPALPGENTTAVQVDLWKMNQRDFKKRSNYCRRNRERILPLILGQSLQALCNCMEADENWNNIDTQQQCDGATTAHSKVHDTITDPPIPSTHIVRHRGTRVRLQTEDFGQQHVL